MQRIRHGVNDATSAHAVGIKDVIRDEQTRVCVNAHGVLVAFQFAHQEHQIRKNLVAKDAPLACSSIRPANAAFALVIRSRVKCCFQVVDALKEFPALSRRQYLHLLQNIFRTHHSNHTTNEAFRANSKPAFLPAPLAAPWAGDESA